MPAESELLIEQFNEIVKADGGRVSLLSEQEGVLRVRYECGVNQECPTCVMSPTELATMMKDMAQAVAPSIQDILIDAGADAEPAGGA